jgi:uncharacterized membrane protein (UPF0136 family)
MVEISKPAGIAVGLSGVGSVMCIGWGLIIIIGASYTSPEGILLHSLPSLICGIISLIGVIIAVTDIIRMQERTRGFILCMVTGLIVFIYYSIFYGIHYLLYPLYGGITLWGSIVLQVGGLVGYFNKGRLF